MPLALLPVFLEQIAPHFRDSKNICHMAQIYASALETQHSSKVALRSSIEILSTSHEDGESKYLVWLFQTGLEATALK